MTTTTSQAHQTLAVPTLKLWIVALTVTLATFMDVLDTSIANVALPHIAGNLGATTEEGTWVITSYLIASAIVLPMSGWLSNLIGRKRFYMTCVALFTLSSFLCALAPTMPVLILCRILQGVGGGGLQPTEQSILADLFPGEKRGMSFALYGVAILAAPAIGPTLGGWITDNYSWHWIFLINIPIGILSLTLTSRILQDPPYLKELRKAKIRIDYIGISLIVLGVGFLQFVLDKGQENDWFSSNVILISLIVAIAALIALVIRELTHENPIMDLRLFALRNFATAVTFSFALGMVMNGSTILLPQFLQSDLGYSAMQAGMALAPGAITIAVMMPVAGILSAKFDPRVIISIGFALTAFGLYHVSNLYLGVSFETILAYRVVQVIGLALIFIPISTLNYVGVPKHKFNQVAGISNFIRNIGGGVGVSLLNNFIARQGKIHRAALTAHTNHANPFFERQLNALTSNFVAMGATNSEATHRALAQLSAQVNLQSSVLSFANAYRVLGFLIVFLVPLPFIMRRPSRTETKDTAAVH